MTDSYLDKAPCLYFSTTDDGTIIDVNERLCSVLQHNKKDIRGKKAEIFYTISTRIFQQTHFFPLLKMQGHAEEIYITLKKADGEEVPVLLNAERNEIEGNAISSYVALIVYNRKKFEEELITAKKTAEAALNENTALIQAKQELQKRSEELDGRVQVVNSQNEELRQFNRVVTHDLQEPLRKLSVFSDMLLQGSHKEAQPNLLAKIKRVANQMQNVISGLQQYVWLTETPPKLVPIDLEKILLLIRQQLEKEFPDVQLNVSTAGLQNFAADWEQMQLLFYQLLSNAIRFRKDDTKATVMISADTLQLNQFKNVEGKYKYVDFLRVQVNDEGIGFNSEFKLQLFGLFKKLHTESGQGIGLALCKKVTDNHKGNISIDSLPGGGTTVTILLPLNTRTPEEKSTLIKS